MNVLENYTLLKNRIASECKGNPKDFQKYVSSYTFDLIWAKLYDQ